MKKFFIVLVCAVLGILLGCDDRKNPCSDYSNSGVHPGHDYVITSVKQNDDFKNLCEYPAHIPKSLYAGIRFTDKCNCTKWSVGDKLQITLVKSK